MLFTRVIYTEWIFFGLMAVGLLILRKRSDLQRDYKIALYPWIPFIFVLSSFIIIVNQIIKDPGESISGLSLVAAGLVVYYISKKFRQ